MRRPGRPRPLQEPKGVELDYRSEEGKHMGGENKEVGRLDLGGVLSEPHDEGQQHVQEKDKGRQTVWIEHRHQPLLVSG